jgi:hypothetical protein
MAEVKGKNKKAGKCIKDRQILMDYVDVKDELIELKNHYEYLCRNASTSSARYRASYSAVALAEAANLVMAYLREPKRFNIQLEEETIDA